MRPYFCYVYRHSKDIPYFEVVTGQDDGEARRHALDLLGDRPQYSYVEVWEDRRLLGAFDREGQPMEIAA